MNISKRLQTVLASTLALGWIGLALRFRHSGDTDPEHVRWALSAMALWFLACGVWTFMRVQTSLAKLFLWYGALSALHWGGPVGIGTEALQTFELVIFVLVGGTLAQATFLDLARRLGGRQPRLTWAPYLPAALGAAVLPALLIIGPGDAIITGSISGLYVVGVLMSLLGGIILLVRPFLRGQDRIPHAILALAIVSGWTPHAVVAAGLIDAGQNAGLYNLALAIIPAVLAWHVARTPPSAAA